MNQRELALALLGWHGGQGSGLYAVGSCMLSASNKGCVYEPLDYYGHGDGSMAYLRAIKDLRGLRKAAIHKSCVSKKHEEECNKLASILEDLHPEVTWTYKELVEVDA